MLHCYEKTVVSTKKAFQGLVNQVKNIILLHFIYDILCLFGQVLPMLHSDAMT